jgi:hypothetical protein
MRTRKNRINQQYYHQKTEIEQPMKKKRKQKRREQTAH